MWMPATERGKYKRFLLPILCVSVLFRPLSRVTLSPTGFCRRLFKWSVLPSALSGVSRVLTGLGGREEAGFHFLGMKSPLNGRDPKAPPTPRQGL